MKTITFEDGYTVSIDRHVVRFVHDGKEDFAHATHWKPVPEDSVAAAFLEKNRKNIADYLFCAPASKWMVVREAIQKALDQYCVREAELNRDRALFQRKRSDSAS